MRPLRQCWIHRHFSALSMPSAIPRKVTLPKSLKDKVEHVPTRLSPTPQEQYRIRFARPVAIGMATSATIFILAGSAYDHNQDSIWQRWLHSRNQSWWPRQLGSYSNRPSLNELLEAKQEMLFEKKRVLMDRVHKSLNALQERNALPEEAKRLCLMVTHTFANMKESDKTLAALIAINVAVFGCWRVPRLAPFMTRWFLHHPGSGRSITLLTSCFSHKEFLHLTLNMVALWSFGGVIHNYLGREQFLAMYLSTGIGANVASHLFHLAFRRRSALLPSLGASGAVYGLLAGASCLYPDAEVCIVFLPFFPFKLGYAIPAILGFDLAGLLLRWRMLDHCAHLAGAGIGVAYLQHGQEAVWKPLVEKIHTVRQNGIGYRET